MYFKKFLLICICALFCEAASAQQFAYQISFTDKQGSSAIGNPSVFLSVRSLTRRAAQGISVDSTDLPVSPMYIDSVLALTSGILHVKSKWLNSCVILLPDSSTITNLNGKPYIRDIKLVGCYSSYLHHKPAKTLPPATSSGALAKVTGNSWDYGQAYIQTIMVNGDYLHDNGYRGQGKLIAVLDAGFTEADIHPGLDSVRDAGGYVDTYNFILDTPSMFGYDVHGLKTLSTMAGNKPGTIGSDTGYIGSAPKAQYALYITQDDIPDQPILLNNLIAGAERADSIGADIISVSLGFNDFDNSSIYPNCDFPSLIYNTDIDGKTNIAAKAANMATSKGMLFVTSAGNDGTNPAWGNHILAPGDADSALTVGAVDLTETCPAFSGYGPNAAGQVKPDVCLLGVSAAVFSTNGITVKEDGTSFSTPQLAGWAACLWQAAGSSTTPYQLRKLITESANHYTNPGTQIGYGIPDFQKALQTLEVKNVSGYSTASANWLVVEGNPFTTSINLLIRASIRGYVDFVLTDMSGRQMLTSTQTFYPGWNPHISLPVPGSLPAGVYMLHAISATQQAVLKVIKE